MQHGVHYVCIHGLAIFRISIYIHTCTHTRMWSKSWSTATCSCEDTHFASQNSKLWCIWAVYLAQKHIVIHSLHTTPDYTCCPKHFLLACTKTNVACTETHFLVACTETNNPTSLQPHLHTITRIPLTEKTQNFTASPPPSAAPSTTDAVVDFDSADAGPIGGYPGYIIVRFANGGRRAIVGAYTVTLDGSQPKCEDNGSPPPASVRSYTYVYVCVCASSTTFVPLPPLFALTICSILIFSGFFHESFTQACICLPIICIITHVTNTS